EEANSPHKLHGVMLVAQGPASGLAAEGEREGEELIERFGGFGPPADFAAPPEQVVVTEVCQPLAQPQNFLRLVVPAGESRVGRTDTRFQEIRNLRQMRHVPRTEPSGSINWGDGSNGRGVQRGGGRGGGDRWVSRRTRGDAFPS